MKRALVLAAVMATGSLLGLAPSAQAELRVGDNYRMSSDTDAFRGKDQLGMAVNPANPQHIVAVHANYLTQDCEGTRSLDGGQTWSAADPFESPAPAPGQEPFLPSCRISNHLAESMFQTVAFGAGNNVYATYITPRGIVPSPNEEGATAFVVKSTDGGLTWSTAVVAMPGGTSSTTGPYYELPTVAVQPGVTTSQDRVYVAAREVTSFGDLLTCPNPFLPPATPCTGDAVFARSTDGGATFAGPVNIEPSSENVAGPDGASQPVIHPNGDVSVAWRAAGVAGTVKIAKSTDQGQNWGAPVNVAGVTNSGSTSTPPIPAPLPAAGSTFPRLAANPANGNLYIVYNQAPPGPTTSFKGADHFISPDSDVYFQRSTNGGANWSAPKLINEDAPKPGHESPYNPPALGVVTQTRHPNVSLAPNGRVDIVWQDRRHWYRGCVHTHLRCEEARLGDTYYSFSTDNGDNFSPNRRISDRSHNNDVGFDYRFGTGWAFGPVAVPQGNDELLVGWMDAREGDFDDDTQDIYLAKVNHAAPAPVPQSSINRTSASQLSVQLSQHAYPGGGEGLLASTFATRRGTRVVIVNENDVPGILAAGVLARANLSQVLVSPAGGLPAGVAAEVDRLNPAGAYVIGDTGSLSNQVELDLRAAIGPPSAEQPREIERLDGGSDAGDAALVARELDRRTQAEKDANDPPAFNAVIVANPGSPDATAASALAAARRLPILYTDAAGSSLPSDSSSVISDLDIEKALVVGRSALVSDSVLAGLPDGERLGGADQYATSAAVVAESLDRGLPGNIAYVADGARPVDAALLGSAVGRITGLLMVAPAPLGTSAASAAQAQGLADGLDRLVLVQPPATPAQAPPNYPQAPSNVINGTPGNDVLNGTPGNDTINGGGGNDTINGGGGNDVINGGTGNDVIDGGAGDDRITCGPGDDRINGGPGNDRISCDGGNDRINGNSGNDRVAGGSGNDRINGNSGRDRLNANSGNDRATGGSGGDRINGNSGRDRLSGNSGNDRIAAGSGRDRVSGGSGRDRINVRGGQVDRVRCGSRSDRTAASSNDVVAGDCETVTLASVSTASLGGAAGLVGGAYVALIGWRRRRTGSRGYGAVASIQQSKDNWALAKGEGA